MMMMRPYITTTMILFSACVLQLQAIEDDVLATAAEKVRSAGVMLDAEALEGPSEWESKISAGVTFKSGNADSENFAGGMETAKLLGRTLFSASAEGAYETTYTRDEDGARQSDQTAGSARVVANIKQRFEDFFLFADVSLYHDDLSDVRYRAIESGGIGTFLLESNTLKFSVETGFAYIHERAPEPDEYLGLRFAERLDWELNESFSLWEKVEMIPELVELKNMLLSSELGVESAINASLSLAVKLKIEYDSDPSEAVETTDSLFMTQLTIKF